MRPDSPPLASFRLLDPAVIENPYPFYRALLREAPVYRVPGTEVYLVSSAELIHQVLRNQDDYSVNLTGILVSDDRGEPVLFDLAQFGSVVDAIANADEPHHAVHRKLVLPLLTARRVARMADEVREWARQELRPLLAAGRGDCVGELANAIPVKVMARLIGLPVADVDQLLAWAFAGGEILAGTATFATMAELSASTVAMRAYLQQHVCQALQRQDTNDDVIGALVGGIRHAQITEQEAVGIMVVLVGAAGESTSSLVGSAIRLLAQDAALQERLRAQPARLDSFIEEVVRLESPFKGHYRAVRRATRLGGVDIPVAARVFLLWAAANRDPAVFHAPDELDLARGDAGAHLGFGHGIHFCIGARLARLETRIILEELLQCTRSFALDDAFPVRHAPSIFVRRLDALHLLLDVHGDATCN